MKEFTIPAIIPEDYDRMFIEGEAREKHLHIQQSGIEGVCLDGDELVDLIRQGHYLIEPLRDAYVQEATDHITRGNEMLLGRLEQATNEELKTYLRSHIDRNQANLLKAKGAFYTPQHDLFMALCSSIPATITLLLSDVKMAEDEKLLEAFKMIEKPIDLSALKGSLSTINPFGPTCGGRRVDMFASELTPEQIRERNTTDAQGKFTGTTFDDRNLYPLD